MSLKDEYRQGQRLTPKGKEGVIKKALISKGHF